MLDVSKYNQWFKLSEDSFNPWRRQAQEDLRFVLGKQWDGKDLDVLREQNRPALTFNHILPLINLISGYQRQNRQDIKIFNKKEGTKEVAEILTAIIKDIHDNSTGDLEVSMAFLLGLVTGKGYLSTNIDYDEDIYNGELKIESLSPFLVYPDPYSERYDWSDATFVFKVAWLPRSRIELIYPDKKNELADTELSTDTNDRMLYVQSSTSSGQDTYSSGEGSSESGSIDEKDKYKYRVKECWWKEYVTETFLYDLYSGKAKRVDLPAKKIDNILKKAKNWRKIKRVVPKMHLTTYVGNVILQDVIPYEDRKGEQYGLNKFPIVPYYPCWIERNHLSIVTPLKDPQQEINKRYSQLLHHLNQSANSGWIGDPDAVADWDELEKMGSRPGVTIKKKKGAALDRIEPTQMSEGHLILAREGISQIKHVSGVDPTLFGVLKDNRKESGIALQIRQRQGITVLEPALDNFRITKQMLGKVLIEMIQKSGTYSKEEIIRLVIDGEEKEYRINQKSKARFIGISRIKNDLSIGKYGCAVAQQPTNPTVRLANFYALIEALKAGLPIPPASIIKTSDLPDKEDIISGLSAESKAKQEAINADRELKQAELQIKQAELELKAKEIELKGSIELAKLKNGNDRKKKSDN